MKGINACQGLIVFAVMLSALGVLMMSATATVPEPEPDFYLNVTATTDTHDWDLGSFTNTSTTTTEYNHTANSVELSFPYASKDNNLVFYSRLENSGITDETGYITTANTGCSFGSTSGYFDYGAEFDYLGNDIINLTNNNLLEFNDGVAGGSGGNDKPFTISMWIKPINALYANATQGFISKVGIGTLSGEYELYWNKAIGRISFLILDSSGIALNGYRQTYVSFTSATYNNTWTHVVATYNGTNTTSDSLNIYVNGVLPTNTHTLVGTYNFMNTTLNNDVRFGVRTSAPTSSFYKGYMDEIKIYNRSLSGSEIKNIYNNGKKYIDTTWAGSDAEYHTNSTTIPANKKLKNVTIDYSNVDANHYIDKVEWLNSTGDIMATNETDIISGDIIFYNTSYLSSGSFDYLNYTEDMKIRVWLSGNGISTPIIYDIYGYYETISGPTLEFGSQTPNDVGVLTLFSSLYQQVNITYKYAGSVNEQDNRTFRFFSKINSTPTGTHTFYSLRGGLYTGWQTNFTHDIVNGSATGTRWNVTLHDNTMYPAIYNYEPELMEEAAMINYTLDNPNKYLLNAFETMNNSKNYTFFEVQAMNITPTSSPLRAYYCNESYPSTPSGIITTDPMCVQFYSFTGATTYNHTHPPNSSHIVIPMFINTTTKSIGNVYVSSVVGYVMLRGGTRGGWNVSYMDSNMGGLFPYSSVTTNHGHTWDFIGGDPDYLIDSHLHQYDGSETYCYYAKLNTTTGLESTSDKEVCDRLELGGLYPTSPDVYLPANTTYSGNFTWINYTGGVSPNGYDISYNISVFDVNFTGLANITNNTNQWSYYWNWTSNVSSGSYIIGVSACDILGQCTWGYSDIFTVDNTPPTITIGSPLNTTYCDNCLWFNVSAQGNASWCGYSLDGKANVTMTSFNITDFYKRRCISSGGCNHNVTFYCNDTAGNMVASIPNPELFWVCSSGFTFESGMTIGMAILAFTLIYIFMNMYRNYKEKDWTSEGLKTLFFILAFVFITATIYLYMVISDENVSTTLTDFFQEWWGIMLVIITLFILLIVVKMVWKIPKYMGIDKK